MDFQGNQRCFIENHKKPQLTNQGEKVQLRGQKTLAKEFKPLFFLRCRVNISLQLKRKLEKPFEMTTKFTTRKLCTCLPSLKSSADSNLKSHVVYELSCRGCSSTYVGQTCRHFATRISEHQKINSPVGQHVVECCGALTVFNYKIIDQCLDSKKLMTIDTLHISRRKPQLNTREEYKSRELTLNY